MNEWKKIESEPLRKVAKHLYMQMIPVTSFGKSWGNAAGNWMYFNTVLDMKGLRDEFDLGEHIVEHENLDPKSGTERGFIDQQTGEGLMGRIG